jgi:hypothetical protein
MSRTLTALYQTREDAQAVADRLKAAGLGNDVDITTRPTATRPTTMAKVSWPS